MPVNQLTVARYIFFALRPAEREPPTSQTRWTFLDALGSALFGGVLAFFLWLYVDRGGEVALWPNRLVAGVVVIALCLSVWAGLRLQRVRDEEHALVLDVMPTENPLDDYMRTDQGEFLIRRTVLVSVRTLGGDAEGVRLNLLRFTPQGRTGAIFLRERHDESPYSHSRNVGFRVQKNAPVVFDLCSWSALPFQPGERLITLHYASIEPNGLRPTARYFFEVQAVGASGARSAPTTLWAEVDSTHDLTFGSGLWPTN